MRSSLLLVCLLSGCSLILSSSPDDDGEEADAGTENPGVTVVPPSVDFGPVLVMGASAPFVFQAVALADTSALRGRIEGEDAADFDVESDGCQSAQLVAGQVCEIRVIFSPTDTGIRTSTLVIADVTVSLQGTGLERGALAAEPESFDFGQVAVNSASAVSTIQIENTGGAPIEIMTLDVNNAAFVVGRDVCTGATLNMNATCDFDLTFEPSASGSTNGTLTVVNDSNKPTPVSLSGEGAYTLVVEVNGSGMVTSNPDGITCQEIDSPCSAMFSQTIVVALTPSGTFLGWGDDCSGPVVPCMVPMDQDHLVTANFIPAAGRLAPPPTLARPAPAQAGP